MKITEVSLRAYSKPFHQIIPGRATNVRDLLVAEVSTDAGTSGMAFLTGLGLAGAGELRTLYAICHHGLGPLLVGEDPLDNERLWEKMYRTTFRFGRRGAVVRAISVLDNALWDLKAKVAKMPLYKLLGAYRDRIPVYASAGYDKDLQLLTREMTEIVERGFSAVKMHIGGRPIDEDLARVRAVRDVIGPNRKLMLDATGHLSLKEAAALIKKLEPYDIFWLEEPLSLDDVTGYGRLAQVAPVRIAAGGGEYTRHGFRPFLERGGLDVVQADATRTGGITEWLKISSLAAAFNIPVAPHAVQEIHVHLVAAIPNGLMIEYFDHDHPLQRFISDVFGESMTPKDGWVSPPTTPGLGLTFNESAAEPYAVNME